jgi:DNA polymerase I-like protein with 3'-5' exonuclease and polymerase domains
MIRESSLSGISREGLLTPKLCIVTEWPLREGWERDFLVRSLLREGIYEQQIEWRSLLEQRPYGGTIWSLGREAIAQRTDTLRDACREAEASLFITLGDHCTNLLTGRSGIDKWQASVLHCAGKAVIPCYPMDRVSKDLSLQVWISLCARKAASELKNPTKEQTYAFLLNPPVEETLAFLRDRVRAATRVSVDIETGRGQINTVGFAISPTEAIAINVLPERLGPVSFMEVWRAITDILQSDQPKVLQNFIYETLFFSRYGIRLNSVHHDTMIAQKFLWPELEMGLDAVGRLYTDMPYWKDDGKSWNNIRDWERHYEYNCKDTVGTLRGYAGQVADLRERGLADLYYGYITKLFPAVAEMCSWGIPLSEENLKRMRAEVSGEYEKTLAALRAEAGAEALNPRSPAQVKKFLSGKGYTIPKKYDSKEKKYKESTDEKSLKKLRMKHGNDRSLDYLLRLSKLGKAHSSYLTFKYDADRRMRFSLNCHGTETGRWSGYCDPWDNGVNPQTVPGGSKGFNIKSIFEAEPGFVFLQCDLRQAESRFVAYDSADLNLMKTLEDNSRDIHSEVAAEICAAWGLNPAEEQKDKQNWKKKWRQLGKKSGHGANYSMKENTFIESCIAEMDLVLTKAEATRVLEAYHKLFPGIRRWHARLRQELQQRRYLGTPLGRVRYFYSRLDDDCYRQAYAYRPQSTIPDVTNHLMLHLLESRRLGAFEFRLLLQCHDSVLLEVPECFVPKIARECLATEHWHPRIDLPGGRLIIPTEVEVGRNWGNLDKWEGES